MSSLRDRSTFETAYTGQAPWDIGRPQQVFLEVADRITGSVLDAGCGTGENALFFASRGHKVTGIDFLEEPIRRAKRKATERGLTATFLVMDALALKDLPEVFDSVIDSGLFRLSLHNLSPMIYEFFELTQLVKLFDIQRKEADSRAG